MTVESKLRDFVLNKSEELYEIIMNEEPNTLEEKLARAKLEILKEVKRICESRKRY